MNIKEIIVNDIKKYFEYEFDMTVEKNRIFNSKKIDLAAYYKDGETFYGQDLNVIEICLNEAEIEDAEEKFEAIGNYLVVPSVLVGYAIQKYRTQNREYVGIIEITQKGKIREVLPPRINFFNFVVDGERRHPCHPIFGFPLHLEKRDRKQYEKEKIAKELGRAS